MARFALIAVAALSLCATRIVAGTPEFYSEAAEARSRQLRREIEEECSNAQDAHWAGCYCSGRSVIVIAPHAGFVFEHHESLGLSERNHGTVQETNNTVYLVLELQRRTDSRLPLAFFPIRWGQRRYLVPTNRVVAFCNSINSGYEPRYDLGSGAFLREGDQKERVQGEPSLPARYRPYLLTQPISAHIKKIGRSSLRSLHGDFVLRETVAVLNVGTKHGVLEGLNFRLHYPGTSTGATAEDVTEESCVTTITQFQTNAPLPSVGWRLSAPCNGRDFVTVDKQSTQQTPGPLQLIPQTE